MGYTKPIIPLKVIAICNILNHTPSYSTSHHTSIVVYHHVCSPNMSMKGSPLQTANRAPPGGLFGSQQCCDDNSGSSDDGSHTTTGKDSRYRKHPNQYQLPHGYGYPPSQQPFPGAPQFYYHSPFDMTHSSQPTTSIRQQYPSYGPP